MTLKDSVQTAILVVGFFSLLVFAASYYFVLIDPDSSNYPLKEALSITASFFGGFATLTAAFIASRLFNDWRFEKDYETKSIYLNNAIQRLSSIHANLIICRSNAVNLKKINHNLIINKEYIDRLSNNYDEELIKLHSDLKIIEKLFRNSSLIEYYNIYDKYIYVFYLFNNELLNIYGTYYYYYLTNYLDSNEDKNIYRSYHTSDPLHQDTVHRINGSHVEKYFSIKLDRTMADLSDKTTYLDHIEDCLKSHEKLIDLCLDELKLKSPVALT